MNQNTLRLSGSLTIIPTHDSPLSSAALPFPLDYFMGVKRKHSDEIFLSTDAPVDVEMGGVAEAAFLVLVVVNGTEVIAEVTTDEGAAQVVPIDPLVILGTKSSPITAIRLTRTAGVDTTILLVTAEKT